MPGQPARRSALVCVVYRGAQLGVAVMLLCSWMVMMYEQGCHACSLTGQIMCLLPVGHSCPAKVNGNVLYLAWFPEALGHGRPM